MRIPASHCGIYGLKPTLGEISTTGMVRGARRLDYVGILARSVHDLAIVLQVLDGVRRRTIRARAAGACRSRRPTGSRAGCAPACCPISNALGVVGAGACAVRARDRQCSAASSASIARSISPTTTSRSMRRAALFVMESELAVELAADLADGAHPLSPRLRAMLDYARGKSAVDYAKADRQLDAGVLKARRVFADVDVLVLPTVPHGPYPLADGERANDADLTSFASLAGCPAISLPMGTLPDGLPAGLQLVGAPGSDLRLLELAEICAATLDAAPNYPVGG